MPYKLSEPLVGDDGRVYACSERNVFAFESNGSIAWSIHLNFSCRVDIAPVCDGRGKIYLIAENKVLKINPPSNGASESTAEIFFGDESTTGGSEEIIGISISVVSSYMFINVKERGLFAYMLNRQFLWSAGPVLYQFGYRQGCKKNISNCHFTSSPVVDQCEGSIYVKSSSLDYNFLHVYKPTGLLLISNTEGQVYSLSIRSPHFKWIQDFSAIDILFTITSGNNGRLYVTFPVKSLVLAVDALTGNNLWQSNIGPISIKESSPVVDSNGWISFGSLDGFLYSISPTGVLNKFLKKNAIDSVIQVSPVVDCSGYALYVSQTKVKGKISHAIGEITYVSALKPIDVVFFLLSPATGSVRNLHAVALKPEPSISVSTQRSLQLKKKAFQMEIKQLEQKVGEEAVSNEVLEKLGDLVREREGIQRKLSTTYSLGRDRTKSSLPSILPLYDGKAKSYSFQGSMKESITTFHTLSETSSIEMSSSDGYSSSWSSQGESSLYYHGDEELDAKGKAPAEPGPSSAPVMSKEKYWESPVEHSSDSKGFRKPLFNETITRELNFNHGEGSEQTARQGRVRRAWLKRRRTFSSTN
ncbi:hypothetical protein Sjap_024154 [Stephania japonica]|uniref:Protein GAMETE EXPRESSED 3 n=1 Tax=Stephania japonica TaxID=461633 RepID=A0AAP0EHN9_9MAGN